jgi:hypothetical protein
VNPSKDAMEAAEAEIIKNRNGKEFLNPNFNKSKERRKATQRLSVPC